MAYCLNTVINIFSYFIVVLRHLASHYEHTFILRAPDDFTFENIMLWKFKIFYGYLNLCSFVFLKIRLFREQCKPFALILSSCPSISFPVSSTNILHLLLISIRGYFLRFFIFGLDVTSISNKCEFCEADETTFASFHIYNTFPTVICILHNLSLPNRYLI